MAKKQSVEVEVMAFYQGVVNCPVCLFEVKFEIPAEHKKNDVECEDCGELFEIKVKEK